MTKLYDNLFLTTFFSDSDEDLPLSNMSVPKNASYNLPQAYNQFDWHMFRTQQFVGRTK